MKNGEQLKIKKKHILVSHYGTSNTPEDKIKKKIYSKISPLTKLIFGVDFNRVPSRYFFSSKKWKIYEKKSFSDSIQVLVFKKKS